MFDCDEVIQLLTDYVDGELEPADQQLLDRHFKGCPKCDNFLKTFKMTIDAIGSYPCKDIPEVVSEKLHLVLEQQIRGIDEARRDGAPDRT